MPRLLSFLICIVTVLHFSSSKSEASDLKITTIPSNCGYVETAHVSYYDGKIYVGGWLKPHYWSSNKIYFQVDVKDVDGKVIATKIGYAYPTGRPHIIAQFGVSYVVSFDATQVKNLAAIDVRYIN